MVSEKEKELLEHLRMDSRKSLAEISKDTGVPISTLFCTLKRLENKTIHKHVSLLDFPKLGYSLRVHFALRAKDKTDLKEFLMKNAKVNSLSSLINGYDFYADCIFRDWKELSDFKERLDSFELHKMRELFVVEELKKEDFSL